MNGRQDNRRQFRREITWLIWIAVICYLVSLAVHHL